MRHEKRQKLPGKANHPTQQRKCYEKFITHPNSSPEGKARFLMTSSQKAG